MVTTVATVSNHGSQRWLMIPAEKWLIHVNTGQWSRKWMMIEAPTLTRPLTSPQFHGCHNWYSPSLYANLANQREGPTLCTSGSQNFTHEWQEQQTCLVGWLSIGPLFFCIFILVTSGNLYISGLAFIKRVYVVNAFCDECTFVQTTAAVSIIFCPVCNVVLLLLVVACCCWQFAFVVCCCFFLFSVQPSPDVGGSPFPEPAGLQVSTKE